MRARTKRIIAGAVLIALTPSTARAIDTDRPDCPEYTTGRVIFGELQTVNCDVSPPQHLDLQMFKGKLNHQTPRHRCDHMGGYYQVQKVRCLNVDY